MLFDIHCICGVIIAKYLLDRDFQSHNYKLLLHAGDVNGFRISTSNPSASIPQNLLNSIAGKVLKYFRSIAFEHKYILVGAILSNVGDFDYILSPIVSFMRLQRKMTHSLFLNMFVIVPLCGVIVKYVLGLRGIRGYLHSSYFSFLCIFMHLYVDFSCNYGLPFLYPFREDRKSAGVSTMLDFTFMAFFYGMFVFSRFSLLPSNRDVFIYTLLGYSILLLWKRSMLIEVYERGFYMLQNLKRKYKNSKVWLYPSNFFNGQYLVMKYDERADKTSLVHIFQSSYSISLINYLLDLLSWRKIDIRQFRTPADYQSCPLETYPSTSSSQILSTSSTNPPQNVNPVDPQFVIFNIFRENRKLFYRLLKHTIPSATLMFSFHFIFLILLGYW